MSLPMSQEMKEKFDMAFRAMKELGVESKIVEPVLKHLLKEYDNHWEYIEAESYRALANAIFEAQASQEGCSTDNKKPPPVAESHIEKRQKTSEDAMPFHNTGRDATCQPHSQNRASSQKRAFFEQSTPAATDKPVLPVPTVPQAQVISSKSREGHDSYNTATYNSALIARDDHAMALVATGEGSVGRCSRGTSQNDNSILLVEPKTEPEPYQLGFGPLVVHPAYALDSSENSHPNSSRSSKDKTKGKGKEILEPEGLDASTNLEIATTGDVNLSFIVRESLLSDPNFQTPSIEAVCRDVEDRCLASYRILDPTFSLLNIFKEMCRSFSELGYTPQKKTGNGNINIVPAPGAEYLFEGFPGVSFNPSSSMFNMALVPTGAPRPHSPDDISRGEEMVQISIARDVGSREEDPLPFHYIARNIPYQNAYIIISLSRIGDDSCCSDCRGNCLQSPFACACSSETAGVFAYTKEGVLRAEFLDACAAMLQEPKLSDFLYCKEECPLERVKNEKTPEKCKGHLMRKFIKECWAKCGCKRQCGNRVVQRGITCNLQVFKTGVQKGWGLRTLENLPKGKFVCEYIGEILTNIELYDRQMSSTGNARHTYPVLLDADWSTEGVLKDEEVLCLDATHYGNIARFINHRCFDGNLIGIPVEIETPDHHYYHLAYFTTRDVPAMEELTWDYGIDFDDSKHPVKAFACICGSNFCRDKKRQASKHMVPLVSVSSYKNLDQGRS